MPRHTARHDRHEPEQRRSPAAPAVRRLPLGAIGAPQLARRSSHAVRAAAVLDAQRRHGNRAVGRVLARDPNPTLAKHRAVRPPKPKLRTGREVDAIFDASPFLKDLVGAKLGKTKVDKAMKIDSDEEFEKAWIAYALRSYNPATGQNYTEAEAEKYLATQGVRAFQDEDAGEIHILKDRADLGTQLHEGLHLFSDDRWRRRMGYNVNEGVTEFFTRKLGAEVQVERDDSSFLRQYTSVTHLVAAAGEDAVAGAYFKGDVAGLKQKVDSRKPGGKGTWEQWLGLLDANDFKGANALMKS